MYSCDILNQRRIAPAAMSPGEQSARLEFLRRMRGTIHDTENRDMSIICQDEVSVSASRLLLISGSSKLKDLIGSELEVPSSFQFFPQQVKIHLDTITSTTLLFILEYLYTGEMFHQWQPKTVQQSCDIIRASRYLEIHSVMQIGMEFLNDMITNPKDRVSKAAVKLSVSLDLETRAIASSMDLSRSSLSSLRYLISPYARSGQDPGQDRLRSDLVRSVSKADFPADLQPAHLRLLSLKAFEHYLEDTKSPALGHRFQTEFQIQEYGRFQQIILWSIIQVRPNGTDDEIAGLLPDQRRAMAFLQRNSWSSGRAEEVNLRYLESLENKRQEFDSLSRGLLRQVDFSKIHPQLLSAVVNPLKMMPENQIHRVYQTFAHNSGPDPEIPIQRSAQWSWEHRSCYKSEEDGGMVVAKSQARAGMAMYRAPISGNFGIFEWAITVLERCHDYCELGFLMGEPNFDVSRVAGHDEGFSVLSGIFLIPSTRVKFRLDMAKRTSSMSVGNDEYRDEWVDLPEDSVFYPAVSLGSGEHGKVRIELLRGFS